MKNESNLLMKSIQQYIQQQVIQLPIQIIRKNERCFNTVKPNKVSGLLSKTVRCPIEIDTNVNEINLNDKTDSEF